MAETVTLEFLAAQQRRILDEIASMRDDIKVLTAIVLRHEETLIRVLEQMTAMSLRTPASLIAYARSTNG
jgi:hypothetical protein